MSVTVFALDRLKSTPASLACAHAFVPRSAAHEIPATTTRNAIDARSPGGGKSSPGVSGVSGVSGVDRRSVSADIPRVLRDGTPRSKRAFGRRGPQPRGAPRARRRR
jgi:hypothetical protein